MQDLSEKIRQIREQKNLTQSDVAAKLQTERSNYARLEKRGLDITVRQLLDIAMVLEVSVGELLEIPTFDSLNDRLETQETTLKELETFVTSYKERLNDKNKIIALYDEIFELIKKNLNNENNSSVEKVLELLSKK